MSAKTLILSLILAVSLSVSSKVFAQGSEPLQEPVKPAEPEAAEPAQPSAEAQKPAEKPKQKLAEPVVTHGEVQEVQGEVSAFNANSISVVVQYDEEKGEETEMVFPLDPKKVKLEHKRSFSDIKVGDYVNVRYREETTDYGDRQKTLIQAVTIRFVKPADDKSRYRKSSMSEAGMVSRELPLKGVK